MSPLALNSRNSFVRSAPILLGRHLLELGVEPGPGMGKILRAVYELQLDWIVTSLEHATHEATKILQKDGS